ncbi:MAG: PmbA/TldA family metallopeptidase, partial [Terriglobales bacterium]
MKHIASWALDTARLRGAAYADVRVADDRQRLLMTKNGKVGHASDSDSLGAGVRVLADGSWGFAASQDLSKAGVEKAAALAVEVARASAKVKEYEARLVGEVPAVDEWASPCEIDPFAMPVEDHLALLLQVDGELRAVEGVTFAEAGLHFRRFEQWFYSSEGADLHQTRHTTGAGFAVYSFAGNELQKRSFPNSFGGQYQNRGYE